MTADMDFLIFLDTDKNGSTGASDFLGADYAIQLRSRRRRPSVERHDVARGLAGVADVLVHDRPWPSARPTWPKTKTFNFGVIASSGSTVDAQGTSTAPRSTDFAPDSGHGFGYQVLTRPS
jgi:hypothetical protein